MSNTITIELCKEDRERLDEIIKGLAKIVSGAVVEAAPLIAETVATVAAAAEQPAKEVDTQPEPVAEEPIEAPKPTVTHDMIRQKVTQLMASGDAKKKAATRSIVKSYADNVTNLPADKWPEIWEKLTALEG